MRRAAPANLLLPRHRSRCPAGSVAVAGKRCAPGKADAGVCAAPAHAVRGTGHVPALPRRVHKMVRAVCRLWWRGPARQNWQE